MDQRFFFLLSARVSVFHKRHHKDSAKRLKSSWHRSRSIRKRRVSPTRQPSRILYRAKAVTLYETIVTEDRMFRGDSYIIEDEKRGEWSEDFREVTGNYCRGSFLSIVAWHAPLQANRAPLLFNDRSESIKVKWLSGALTDWEFDSEEGDDALW